MRLLITANKVLYVFDCAHIKGHDSPLECANRFLLPEFSYNGSSMRSGVIGMAAIPTKEASSPSSWNEYAGVGALI
jgi:hypothetical protein